ncbi:hypothetical protein [Fibrella arboris]|uniref:hypothetical protein n=1 Tax=Fibrella arboris TaxID=3242486 RepID=UPI00352035BF
MNPFSDSEVDQAQAAFRPLPLFDSTLRSAPDCLLKSCCKKYKKGKRCKSCPKK